MKYDFISDIFSSNRFPMKKYGVALDFFLLLDHLQLWFLCIYYCFLFQKDGVSRNDDP